VSIEYSGIPADWDVVFWVHGGKGFDAPLGHRLSDSGQYAFRYPVDLADELLRQNTSFDVGVRLCKWLELDVKGVVTPETCSYTVVD